jgi:uncharacterized protein (TIGR03067 family)
MNAILLGTAILVGAPAPKEAPKKETSIVGEWTLESETVGGREMPKPSEGMIYEYTADGTFFSRKGGVEVRGSRRGYKVDGTNDPAELDLEAGSFAKVASVPGIYKIEGDKLTICLNIGTGNRPTSFQAEKGDRTSLMVFKRVKKKG